MEITLLHLGLMVIFSFFWGLIAYTKTLYHKNKGIIILISSLFGATVGFFLYYLGIFILYLLFFLGIVLIVSIIFGKKINLTIITKN